MSEVREAREYRNGEYSIFYLNRMLCDVLEEMRKCCSTANYSYLPGLIEEAQSMGNRMENGLQTKKEVENAIRYKEDLEREIRELIQERDGLR